MRGERNLMNDSVGRGFVRTSEIMLVVEQY